MTATATTFPRAFAVWFSEMERWDVAFFRQVKWRWPVRTIRPLGEAVIRHNVPVDPDADPTTLPIISKISFGGELTVTAPDERRGYKGRLFWAEAGDLVYSKIRVKQGSLCIVPDSVGKVAVSAEYPVYQIARDVADADYVALVVRSTPFMRLLEGLSHGGSTKTRIPPEEFQRQMIPLPPLPVQRKIVASWEAARKDAAATTEKIVQLERDIETEFLNAIGIRVEPPRPVQGPLVMQWSEFERWDLFYYRHDFLSLEKCLDSIETTTVGEGLRFTSRGWQRSDFPQGTFRYVEISNVTKTDGIMGARVVSVDAAPSRATTLVHAGELLISTTRPYLGAFAIVPCEYDDCVCSSGFSLCTGTRRDDLLLPFVLEFLKSPAGLIQMERRMTGGLYPAITQDELEKVRIPVPTLSMQRQIVERVAARRAEIAKLKADAKARAEAAKADVEAMILGTKPV